MIRLIYHAGHRAAGTPRGPVGAGGGRGVRTESDRDGRRRRCDHRGGGARGPRLRPASRRRRPLPHHPRGFGRPGRAGAHRPGRRLPARPRVPGAADRLPRSARRARLRRPRSEAVRAGSLGAPRRAVPPGFRSVAPPGAAAGRNPVADRDPDRQVPSQPAAPPADAPPARRHAGPWGRARARGDVRPRNHDARGAARGRTVGRHHRSLLPPVIRRDPPRSRSRGLEPDVRVRVQDAGDRRHRRAGGRHGGDPGTDRRRAAAGNAADIDGGRVGAAGGRDPARRRHAFGARRRRRRRRARRGASPGRGVRPAVARRHLPPFRRRPRAVQRAVPGARRGRRGTDQQPRRDEQRGSGLRAAGRGPDLGHGPRGAGDRRPGARTGGAPPDGNLVRAPGARLAAAAHRSDRARPAGAGSAGPRAAGAAGARRSGALRLRRPPRQRLDRRRPGLGAPGRRGGDHRPSRRAREGAAAAARRPRTAAGRAEGGSRARTPGLRCRCAAAARPPPAAAARATREATLRSAARRRAVLW